jgi:hypothetical protein
VLFVGRLFAGKLFDGKLFGVEEEEVPQAELPLEYHGSGEADIIRKVIEKWETIERARAKRSKRREVQVDLVPVNPELAPTAISEPPQLAEDESFDAQDVAREAISKAAGLSEKAHEFLTPHPLIQPTFVPIKREGFAPTRSTTATVQPADEMDDVMVVLLALEEAGEL